MSEVYIPVPFEAYCGDEPYLFVCYAHRDAAVVFPLLTCLRDCGYRIWYDEGIDPGNEWPEELAVRIVGCRRFLVFLSEAAVKSRHVRNEINFAVKSSKSMVVVQLELVDLPLGVELQIGGIQHIVGHRMSLERIVTQLTRALGDQDTTSTNHPSPAPSIDTNAVPGLPTPQLNEDEAEVVAASVSHDVMSEPGEAVPRYRSPRSDLASLLNKSSLAFSSYPLVALASCAMSASHAWRLAQDAGWDERASASVRALSKVYFSFGQQEYLDCLRGC